MNATTVKAYQCLISVSIDDSWRVESWKLTYSNDVVIGYGLTDNWTESTRYDWTEKQKEYEKRFTPEELTENPLWHPQPSPHYIEFTIQAVPCHVYFEGKTYSLASGQDKLVIAQASNAKISLLQNAPPISSIKQTAIQISRFCMGKQISPHVLSVSLFQNFADEISYYVKEGKAQEIED